jgi:hypothetical protein
MALRRRKFLLLYQEDSGVFVLYGTPESVKSDFQESVNHSEQYPEDGAPPIIVGELELNPIPEVARLLDEVWRVEREEDGEGDRFFDVLEKLAVGLEKALPEVETIRRGERQFAANLAGRLIDGARLPHEIFRRK